MRLLVSFFFILAALTAGAQENRTDEDGKKQGEWVKKYPSGDPEFKGTFKDDRPVGKFVYFSRKGEKSAEVEFNEDGSAYAEFFYENGEVAGEGNYAEKEIKTGEWKFYDKHGNLKSKLHFKENKKHGDAFYFYSGGDTVKKTTFKNGLENGRRVEYFENGKIKMEGNMVDGNYSGEVKAYHPDGELKQKGIYRNAVRDSIWISYDENGRPEKKLIYSKGHLIKKEEVE